MRPADNDYLLEYRLPASQQWEKANDYTDGSSATTLAALIRIIKPEVAVRVSDWDGKVVFTSEVGT